MKKDFTIMPAILETKRRFLGKKLKLAESFAKETQIDVVDGALVPKISWPYTANMFDHLFKRFSLFYKGKMELHLMVKNNEAFLEEFGSLGCTRAISQVESDDIEWFIDKSKKYGFKEIGISVMLETPLRMYRGYLPKVSSVQFMSIDHVGIQGDPFNRRVLDKIRKVRSEFPDIEIAVDGGVCTENIKDLYQAGARRFAVGSCIFKSEKPKDKFKELNALLK